jgi:peptidoglycan/LPS O-acetylase OafA/YrhL
MAFYGLVFCTMLTRTITLRHLAFGLTIWSALFNVFSLVVLSGVFRSGILYFVVLMFRVPCAAFLLNHGCFFALGIWLFMSSKRELTIHEWLAVAVTVLSGFAEIYYFTSYILTNIPIISDQSPFVPVAVWAASVLLIAVAAHRSRRPAAAASAAAAGSMSAQYLRTLGLITYPLYLIHNVVGLAIIRLLVDAGLDQSVAVAAGLGLVVLVSWFICAKVEPAIRGQLAKVLLQPAPVRVRADDARR